MTRQQKILEKLYSLPISSKPEPEPELLIIIIIILTTNIINNNNIIIIIL